MQISYLEACIREYLNLHAERAMAVLKPLKLTITNYEGKEELDFDVNPNDEEKRTRKVLFTKNLFIDADDFSLTRLRNISGSKRTATCALKTRIS